MFEAETVNVEQKDFRTDRKSIKSRGPGGSAASEKRTPVVGGVNDPLTFMVSASETLFFEQLKKNYRNFD